MKITDGDIVEYINEYTIIFDGDLKEYPTEELEVFIDGEVHHGDFVDTNGEVSTVELLTVDT